MLTPATKRLKETSLALGLLAHMAQARVPTHDNPDAAPFRDGMWIFAEGSGYI